MDSKSILEEIADINRETGAPDITLPVNDLLHRDDKSIYLVVLGQFKSGKSSLINHILGINLLPVGVVPVTAIVTRIRFAEKPGLFILHENGDKTSHPLHELSQYVTEKNNPGNIKKVIQAIVEHPAMAPFKKISLVDTPGLGSLYKHNSAATRQWLPFTGTSIVCVSAERPLSEQDIELIKGVSQYCPAVTLVITKSDLFNSREIREIEEHVSGEARKALGRNIPVCVHSTIPGNEKTGNVLIEQLLQPLQSGYEAIFQDILRYKTRNIIDQSIFYAQLAVQSAAKRESEKESVKGLLDEIRSNRTHYEREMLLSATAFKNDTREQLEKIILPHLPSVIESIDQRFLSDYQDQ